MTGETMPKTLFEALARFQSDLPSIRKAETGKIQGQTKDGKPFSYEYKYADLADVSDAVLKRIGKLGLFFTAWPVHRRDEDGQLKFGLDYTLGHVSGETREGWWELRLRDGVTMQQMGGMITYARRYCLLAVTGAAPAGDDDDAAAELHHPSRQEAVDVWERSTPTRPAAQQQRPRAVPSRPAATRPAEAVPPSDDRPWREQAIEKAKALKSENAADKLWHEALAKAENEEITPEQFNEIREEIGVQVEKLRKQNLLNNLRLLSEDDSWRPKIEELADNDGARSALEELGRLIADGTIGQTRGARIKRAIVAGFPRAADTDSEQVA